MITHGRLKRYKYLSPSLEATSPESSVCSLRRLWGGGSLPLVQLLCRLLWLHHPTPLLTLTSSPIALLWDLQTSPHLLLFVFLGPHLQHMEVRRLAVESELQLPASTTAHGNAGSLTH